MLYSVLRLRGERVVVALVDRWQINPAHGAGLIAHLGEQFHLPAMLVARDDNDWRNARAYADFDPTRHLYELLSVEEVDWNEME
jgi:hypothetical protein